MCYISNTKKEVAMISSNELINLIKGFSITERLMIVEEILRNIREENVTTEMTENSKEANAEPAILSLAGVIDKEEADVMTSAVEESRRIDRDEW
jgi:hypothetical protein